jgi:anaerobic ribonucleoside-triphosphate reductase
MFTTLSEDQLNNKKTFIDNYISSINPATGSVFDANANIVLKNIATLEGELNKDFNIQINRKLLGEKIKDLYGEEARDEYYTLLNNHVIYTHDESTIRPYCASISMYPLLLHGLTTLGGESEAPKHLASFCGSFVNLIFAVSSQFAGAVASVEWLMYFDYFARKDFGDDYLKTHTQTIVDWFQHVVYCLNQPAAARNYQCVREDTTQLSTPSGYKYLSELKEGDDCYVWKNGKIAVEKIKKLNVHDFNGDLYQFKGRNYQQTVTPNHRVVYKKPNTNEYGIKKAKDLFGHSKLSLPVGSDGVEREDYEISDSLLKLLVAVLTDGSINPSTKGITIYKSKNRYGYTEIPEWLDDLSIPFNQNDCKGNCFGDVVCFRITSEDSKVINELLSSSKKRVPEFFNQMSKRQIKLVLETWSKFDGHGNLLQCDDEDILDGVQQLATLAGIGSEKFYRTMKTFDGVEECVVTYIKLFKRQDKRVSEYNKVPYEGKVWCPTTDAGVVIFREENNIPYISGNSTFWNISIFDKYYFDSMFGDFVFPDMTKPSYESLDKLQKFFLSWLNDERSKALLTFPVVTCALLTENKEPKDKDLVEFLSSELAEGNSFFVYMSDSADSLSSCCRLRNEMADNTFSYTLGAGGVSTGSLNVITINLNRVIQQNYSLEKIIESVHKFQIGFKELFNEFKKGGLLPVYSSGFIEDDKQYLTLGINGLVEAAESLEIEPVPSKDYQNFVKKITDTFYRMNRKTSKETGLKFNTEMVPAENLGVKNANWDKKSGLEVNRDCYNSYFYRVEDPLNVYELFKLYSKEYTEFLDGGSALHINLLDVLTKEQYKKFFDLAAKTGCSYWCTNAKTSICNNCGHISKRTMTRCSNCGCMDIDYATRIIGYLKRITSFSKDRQKEASKRDYK